MSKSVRVVSGEASESDEEWPPPQAPDKGAGSRASASGTEDNSASIQMMVKLSSPIRQKAIIQSAVVSGEASESSEEEMEIDTTDPNVIPLQVNQRQRGDSLNFSPDSRPESQSSEVSEKESELKYDTLFHRKLREKNATLRRHLCDTLGQVYISSAKEVKGMTQGLVRSLIDIQDVSENMRSLTNTLFSLEDKVDIISGCNLLPNIDISPTNTPTSPETPPTS